MKRIVASLLLFHLASATRSATRVPTAIEFRAAYSVRMMQRSARQLSSDQNVLEQVLQARRKADRSPRKMQDCRTRSCKECCGARKRKR